MHVIVARTETQCQSDKSLLAMKLTAFTDYARRTLFYLGLNPGRLSTIDEICDAY